MKFWTLAFENNWITAEALKGAVKTELNPFGEITPEEYKRITGDEYTALYADKTVQ
ncbi:XkdX family protein [Paenibacillus sp. alder61]|uniref:XkdX family protein n=1 Tax=Paenibacillus sp. alder61 TaxID=2862948 RepID=UPI001CD23F28|nr:XkdX family protein [Paenibacillus sp. alder61]MCA1293112.1 XkdX family protein [Paenibacillus sp. alder61]